MKVYLTCDDAHFRSSSVVNVNPRFRFSPRAMRNSDVSVGLSSAGGGWGLSAAIVESTTGPWMETALARSKSLKLFFILVQIASQELCVIKLII